MILIIIVRSVVRAIYISFVLLEILKLDWLLDIKAFDLFAAGLASPFIFASFVETHF